MFCDKIKKDGGDFMSSKALFHVTVKGIVAYEGKMLLLKKMEREEAKNLITHLKLVQKLCFSLKQKSRLLIFLWIEHHHFNYADMVGVEI